MKFFFKYFFLAVMLSALADQRLVFARQGKTSAERNRTIDSLANLLKTAKEDTNCVKIYYDLSQIYVEKFNNTDKAFEYAEKGKTLSKKLNWPKGVAAASFALNRVYYFQNRQDKQLEVLMEALKIYESLDNKNGMASIYNNIGAVYSVIHKYEKSLEFYKKAYDINNKIGNKKRLGTNLLNMGETYTRLKEYDKAIESGKEALIVFRTITDTLYIGYSLSIITNVYLANNQPQKALSYSLESLMCFNLLNEKHYVAATQTDIGKAYFLMGKLDSSIFFLKKAIHYFSGLNDRNSIIEYGRAAQNLSQVYEKLNQFEKAFRYYKTHKEIKDSLNLSENTVKISQLETKYESEQKEKIRQLEEAKKESEHQAEVKQQKIIIWSAIGGLLLVFMFSVFLGNRYRVTQKQKKMIEEQKQLVEEKNKDITDSINYAKRIQEAILPAKEIKYRIFPDAFVLFQPKDVVSGDFYWFAEKNGRKLISAVDCTGHGVPGAFMSMIGNAFLNEIVNQRGITQPSEILSELRYGIIHSLKQSDKEGGAKDGMDIALLSFDDENNVLEFAGAHNPLLRCRKENGSYKMEEVLADKRPIGYYLGKGLPFTNQKINLQKGDTFYIFTDGYADQFGGPKGKKFKYRQLQEVLLSVQNEPMQRQEEILLDTFNKWKGNLEQVDDVLIIGIRI